MADPIGAHAVPDSETGPSDLDLVERTRSGDARAFAELWNRHSRAGRTVARSFGADADDIVSESFAKVLQAIRNGGGPTSAFRPYLFSTIRNVAMQLKRGAQIDTSDELDALADPTSEETETLLALDKSLTAHAFRSLPTRWQEALWYSEVEQLASHEIAPLLGMTSNAVSALTFRAREGLRQAWIQAHLVRAADTECASVIEKLGSYTRGSLGARETRKVQEHLAACPSCSIVGEEARDVGSRLALVLLPLVAGIAGAAAYTVSMQGGGSAAVTSASAALGHAGAAPALGHAGAAPALGHAGAAPTLGHAGAPTVRQAASPSIHASAATARISQLPGRAAVTVRGALSNADGARRSLATAFPRATNATWLVLATAAAVGAAFLVSPLIGTASHSVDAAPTAASSAAGDAERSTVPLTRSGGAASTQATDAPPAAGGAGAAGSSTQGDGGASGGAGGSAGTRSGSPAAANFGARAVAPTPAGKDDSPLTTPPGPASGDVATTPSPPQGPSTAPPTVPTTDPAADPTPTPTPTPTTTPPALPPAPLFDLTADPDGLLFPVVSGRAEPGATVEVFDLAATTLSRTSSAMPDGSSTGSIGPQDEATPPGVLVAQAMADPITGTFTLADYPGLGFGDHRLALRQVTMAGVRSLLSAGSPVTLAPITLVNPQPGSMLGNPVYTVDARGVPGAFFEQLLDGRRDPRTFAMNPDGNFRDNFPIYGGRAAGSRATVSIRYTDPDTGRHGPDAKAEVVVG